MVLYSDNSSSDKANKFQTPSDPIELYFECITTCSMEDGDCVDKCVDELKNTNY